MFLASFFGPNLWMLLPWQRRLNWMYLHLISCFYMITNTVSKFHQNPSWSVKWFLYNSLHIYRELLLIVISININETYRSKIKFAKKKNKSRKQGGILIYSNSFTQLFNIHITKCKYPWIYMRLLEILDKSQKK